MHTGKWQLHALPLDYAASMRRSFAAVFNALFVATIFWLAGGLAAFIPLASLAGVLNVIGWGLIDWTYVECAAAGRTRSSAS